MSPPQTLARWTCAELYGLPLWSAGRMRWWKVNVCGRIKETMSEGEKLPIRIRSSSQRMWSLEKTSVQKGTYSMYMMVLLIFDWTKEANRRLHHMLVFLPAFPACVRCICKATYFMYMLCNLCVKALKTVCIFIQTAQALSPIHISGLALGTPC